MQIILDIVFVEHWRKYLYEQYHLFSFLLSSICAHIAAELYVYGIVLYCIRDVLISRYVVFYLTFCNKDRGASFGHFSNFTVMISQSDISRTMVLINLNSINGYKILFNINLFTD
jgi:hypothetical protein